MIVVSEGTRNSTVLYEELACCDQCHHPTRPVTAHGLYLGGRATVPGGKHAPTDQMAYTREILYITTIF